MKTASVGSNTLSFTYNHDGIRTSKTVNGVVHNYTVSGSLILTEEWGTNLVVYLYDANGAPIGMRYRTSSMAEGVFYTFWFDKNLQGDVVAVYNETGTKVLSYTYDAWGNKTTTVHNSSGTNSYAQYNAITYRGYYYDAETGFYYLQSRYYDPINGRFINADSYASTGQGILGYNMFAYCRNNPVCRVDVGGTADMEVVDLDGNPSIDEDDIQGGGGAGGNGGYSSGGNGGSSGGGTPIYRYGGTSPNNLVPTTRDVKTNTGLSFSTKWKPGAATTTIEEINATGILRATQDGPYHVSVVPVGKTIREWYDCGSNSIWTQTLVQKVSLS